MNMELVVIDRVYDKYAVWSYTEQNNVDVIDEYVLTKTEMIIGITSVNEYSIYKRHGRLGDELLAVFYNEDRARQYLQTLKGVE